MLISSLIFHSSFHPHFSTQYYNSDLSIWISVDPMVDKYPNLSPYVYCANNPVRLVDEEGKEISSPDRWIVDHTNKTLTRVSNEGGDMFQYVNGTQLYCESKDDFIKEYASQGYKINTGDATKSVIGAGIDTYSGCKYGWYSLSKKQQQKFSYDLSKSLKNNGWQGQTRQLKGGINRTFSSSVSTGVYALNATIAAADLYYSYNVLDGGTFGPNSSFSLGSSVGGLGGAALGCKIGGVIGSAVGPVGTVAGGIIGSVVGGFFGAEVGSNVGKKIYDFLNK